MADYHLHAKVISRGKGRSAVGAAAYRSGERLESEKDGLVHDYTKKTGVVHSEIMPCANAPEEYADRETLWNAVESGAALNTRLARDFDIALPVELDLEEQVELVRSYVKDSFVSMGMCADFSLHDKGDGNPHAHVMLTMRPVGRDGKWENAAEKVYVCKDRDGNTAELSAGELKAALAAGRTFEKQLPYFRNGKGKAVYLTKHEAENDPKYRAYTRVKGKNDPLKTKDDRRNPKLEEWDSREIFIAWRRSWAEHQNRALEKKGLDVRVDHRSYEARGIDKAAGVHRGASAGAMERKGGQSIRGGLDREVKNANRQLARAERQDRASGSGFLSAEEAMRPAQDPPSIAQDYFDIAGTARRLAAFRAEFVDASAVRDTSVYRENPDYRTQAAEIAVQVEAIRLQDAEISRQREKLKKLALFSGQREKIAQKQNTGL